VDIPTVEPIELTEQEQALFSQINFVERTLANTSPRDVNSVFSASAELYHLLVERDAIPEVRIRYFVDPECNIGGRGKSRKDIFQQNGTSGEAILRHPHFTDYLRYFALGPHLPRHTISAFRQILIDDLGTTGMLLDQLCKFTRAETRVLAAPSRYDIHEDFFKLALECGLDLFFASSVRKAAQSAK
jgi:hypothetical protein